MTGTRTLQVGDRVLIVANPATRREIEPILSMLRKTAPAGVELDIRVTSVAGEARTLAQDHAHGAAMVVAIGGDGTVADVAGSLEEGRIPLAIVAAGSTNIIGRQLGIPTDPARAAALFWGQHDERLIDAGRCNDRVFLHMAGVGFDSELFARTDRRLKRKVGWMAYLPAGASALREKPAHFHIVVDDEELDVVSPLVLVANGSAIIHPMLTIHPDIDLDDGKLDLIVVTATTPTEIARTLGRAATRSLSQSPFIMHRQATTVTVRADRDIPVQVDGDVTETLPATFRIDPRSVRVVVPLR
ncbi:MAG: diacylglycerol kinase family protein [Thermomicrobiales bacterium]